jgi:hypothetical protein
MSDEVSKTTIESEGYIPEIWSRVLGLLINSNVEPDIPEQLSISDFVEHEENESGATLPFKVFNGMGYIYLEYSPYLLSEHNLLFKGSVYINENKLKRDLAHITPLSEDYRIGNSRADEIDYFTVSRFEQDLPEIAYVEVPGNPDFSKFLSAFNACQKIIDMVYSYSEQNLESWPEQEHQDTVKQSEKDKSANLQLLSENK